MFLIFLFSNKTWPIFAIILATLMELICLYLILSLYNSVKGINDRNGDINETSPPSPNVYIGNRQFPNTVSDTSMDALQILSSLNRTENIRNIHIFNLTPYLCLSAFRQKRNFHLYKFKKFMNPYH